MKGNTKPPYKNLMEGHPLKSRKDMAKPMKGEAKAPAKGKKG
jgi:hypothetical protein